MAVNRRGFGRVAVIIAAITCACWGGCDGPSQEETTRPDAGGAVAGGGGSSTVAPPASGCTPQACAEQGAQAFESGNFKEAMQPLEYACSSQQAGACVYLGKIYERGNGVGQDFANAAKLYEQACQGSDGEGCQMRGHLARNGRGQAADPKQAYGFYQRACDAGDGLGCAAAGDLMYSGTGVPESLKGAVEYFERACEHGQLMACLNAGELLFDPTGEDAYNQRAVKVLTRGCEGGKAEACVKLGVCYYKGVGVPADPQAAQAHFKKGCDAGASDGCHVVAQLQKAKGKSVQLELTTAVESSNIDGLTAKHLECRMREQGYMAIGEIMTSLGKQKKALEGCAAAGEAPTISWSFANRRVTSVQVDHTSDSKVKTCIAKAVKKTKSGQHGSCKVTLLLGDRDKAAAALSARASGN